MLCSCEACKSIKASRDQCRYDTDTGHCIYCGAVQLCPEGNDLRAEKEALETKQPVSFKIDTVGPLELSHGAALTLNHPDGTTLTVHINDVSQPKGADPEQWPNAAPRMKERIAWDDDEEEEEYAAAPGAPDTSAFKEKPVILNPYGNTFGPTPAGPDRSEFREMQDMCYHAKAFYMELHRWKGNFEYARDVLKAAIDRNRDELFEAIDNNNKREILAEGIGLSNWADIAVYNLAIWELEAVQDWVPLLMKLKAEGKSGE